MSDTRVKVLLVDDDEDDFVITRDLISKISGHRYQLDWINNYEDALAAVQRREHDICLLDYRLGPNTGLDLLRESQSFSLRPPMILLTGQGDQAIDIEAMKAGAADYLVKGQLTPDQLDRAIRYAIERKRAEERLRRERDLISRIMETSPVGVLVADRAGKITFANHCAEDVLGLGEKAIEQKQCSVLDWRVADAEGMPVASGMSPLKELLETNQPVLDICHTLDLPGNRRVLLSTNAAPLFDASGKIDGMVVTVEDITDRLALEAQLRQSQKMESVGQLAAGVAHDINNVLTVIQGHTGLLLNAAPPNSGTLKSLKQIAAAADRAASFIRHLLTFSRKQVAQTKVIDLNAVLRNLENMLPRMLGEQIALELTCDPKAPPVAADAGMIEQIVMNLAVNARDAMPRGGRLWVRTEAIEIPMALARQNPEARAGNFVCLTVRDTGSGIEQKFLTRIFEPFFTTKDVGKGTGLGLATVYGIVKQHRGWIEVESALGIGTVFNIYLPVASDRAGAAATACAPKPEQVNGGKETILVVEDEISLLGLVRNVLQRYQYRVLIAASGPEALEVWEKHGDEINLLLTDMVMPGGMTGGDLAAELKKRKPGLKVIFTSGYCAEMAGNDFTEAGGIFLPKPYQPQMIARLVRETLDAPAEWSAESLHASVQTATHLAAPSADTPRILETRTASAFRP
jgi:two-component system cell cycle sensor histidine kinase/response regulator CckA